MFLMQFGFNYRRKLWLVIRALRAEQTKQARLRLKPRGTSKWFCLGFVMAIRL